MNLLLVSPEERANDSFAFLFLHPLAGCKELVPAQCRHVKG